LSEKNGSTGDAEAAEVGAGHVQELDGGAVFLVRQDGSEAAKEVRCSDGLELEAAARALRIVFIGLAALDGASHAAGHTCRKGFSQWPSRRYLS